MNNKEDIKVNTFDSNEALSSSLSERIAELLAQAIEQRGEATLVVSGGRTPKPLFAALNEKDIEWSKVTILLADERWVSPDSDDSNDKLIKTCLLKNKAGAAKYVSLFTGHEQASNAAAALEAKVAALPKFDVVVLGMGNDGHTASLFPCCAQLEAGLTQSNALIATQPTTAPYNRLSLTKQRLLNSHHVFFHITGDEKWSVLQTAMERPDPTKYPISDLIHAGSTPIDVYYSAA
tara:strand:+ start:1404 stop:2108 length:705 start_codon:yes stop_codon:yes gene_type:complete